ncbi:MAG TPA: ribose-phosphate pyrophosphokinase-like domain-containing protein, partial [Myxococcaceae bacterium]|nr:ribose-phosphate pyrophosphokinase-like domain-containing protein [Myxococcaceae bacterium]
MGEHTRLIFSTAADAVLAEKLSALGVGVPGDIERETFPDGERGLRLVSRVADSDAFLVGGTGTDADTLELYDLACALVECGVHALTLVVPYFGYSTQERPSNEGDSVTAKTRARLLSSIPLPDGGLRVLL